MPHEETHRSNQTPPERHRTASAIKYSRHLFFFRQVNGELFFETSFAAEPQLLPTVSNRRTSFQQRRCPAQRDDVPHLTRHVLLFDGFILRCWCL